MHCVSTKGINMMIYPWNRKYIIGIITVICREFRDQPIGIITMIFTKNPKNLFGV